MGQTHERSARLFREAQQLIPGGVNSPVRAFKAVGGDPRFIARGAGSRIWDADGNEYIDCVGSWGPLILGHARGEVIAAACEAAKLGTTFGAPTGLEVRLARAIVDALPSVEMVRLVNSGTEAVMSAVRLARAFTGRSKVVKLEGGYHGHSDGLLAKAGSGLATLSLPGSPGVPAVWAAETIVLPYNDSAAAEELMRAHGGEVACIIVEPVAGNMGVVPPASGFLATLRRITKAAGSLLIFDEVITGFRVGYHGAQALYGIRPDLTVLGKIIGGGFPIGAFGGRREIMEMLAPAGPVYQAGTLSGNPVACAAGLATLDLLVKDDPYPDLERRGAALAAGLAQAAANAGLPAVTNRVGSMLTLFFTSSPVTDYASASASDTARYASFFRELLSRGVYFPPSQFEAVFVSAAHSDDDVARIRWASAEAMSAASRG